MFFSIIIGFRNRDASRIKNALNSISKQSFSSFELIFIDYGSDDEVAVKTEQLVSSYSFCKYYYYNSRGWFWNRAQALNTGIKHASGDVLLVYDIDLIIEDDFLKKISVLDYDTQFYTFSCFYLPQHFDIASKNVIADGIHFEQNYVGLCAVKREFANQIQGFDEFYMIWGGEDDDFYKTLESHGLQRNQTEASEYMVFHQWHSVESPLKPSLWYLTMVNYLYRKSGRDDVNLRIRSSESKRVIFEKMEKNDFDVTMKLSDYSSFLIFNNIINDFYSNQFRSGCFVYNHPKTQGRRKQALNLLKRKKEESPSYSIKDLVEFFQYFIGINRRNLLDYYFEAGNGNVRFYYIRS